MRPVVRLMMVAMMFFVAWGDENKKELKDSRLSIRGAVMRVATDASYPPFSYKEGNKVVGFDIDMLDAISKVAGFKYQLVVMKFNEIIPALKSGKVDMAVASMSATQSRKADLSFTNLYYDAITGFMKRKDSSINSIEDLKGKKIGVCVGTVQDSYATSLASKDPSISVVRSDSISGVMSGLKDKKVDVVLVDKAYGDLQKDEAGLVSFMEMPDEDSDGIAVAFPAGKNEDLRKKINETLVTLRVDGTWDRLTSKYKLD